MLSEAASGIVGAGPACGGRSSGGGASSSVIAGSSFRLGGIGAGSATGGGETPTGEPAYLLTLEVFVSDDVDPHFTLRSVIPMPDSEREDGGK